MLESTVPFIKEYPYVIAPFLGIIPALFWLWFWLKEDIHPESHKMITLSFLGGMSAVLLVLPLQQFIYEHISNNDSLSFLLYAALEELFKFGTVFAIALSRKNICDEPVDDLIYLIISALGFVSMENTLFLITPLHNGDLIDTAMTGNLRFIGASLLHTISSATVGLSMALSFYKSKFQKGIFVIWGLILAIALHTIFNLLIIRESDQNIFFVFGGVWVGMIALLLVFEKVKHMKSVQI